VRALAEIIHLRTGDCRDAAEGITQIAAGEIGDVEPRAAAHVAQCLRCQAEVAAFRRILRSMKSMTGEGMVPPVGGVAAILAALEVAAVEQHSWAVRAAYVGGITVATAAAGAAGVLVWMNRRRYADAG
jgi:hypothetical protein